MSLIYNDIIIPGNNIYNEKIYSTDEIKIGTYINGKPLYKKSWIDLGSVDLSNAITSSVISIPDYSDIMEIKSYSGKLTRISPEPATLFLPGTCAFFISVNGPALIAMAVFGVYSIDELTLEYTKTTDIGSL